MNQKVFQFSPLHKLRLRDDTILSKDHLCRQETAATWVRTLQNWTKCPVVFFWRRCYITQQRTVHRFSAVQRANGTNSTNGTNKCSRVCETSVCSNGTLARKIVSPGREFPLWRKYLFIARRGGGTERFHARNEVGSLECFPFSLFCIF